MPPFSHKATGIHYGHILTGTNRPACALSTVLHSSGTLSTHAVHVHALQAAPSLELPNPQGLVVRCHEAEVPMVTLCLRQRSVPECLTLLHLHSMAQRSGRWAGMRPAVMACRPDHTDHSMEQGVSVCARVMSGSAWPLCPRTDAISSPML